MISALEPSTLGWKNRYQIVVNLFENSELKRFIVWQ